MYKNRFDGGEIDKWALGAVDDPMYRMGLAWLENMGQLENGGLNRRRGWERLCEILAGTGDEAVKLVPVPVDAATSYVVFVSKSKYGYVKFVNGAFAGKREYDSGGGFNPDAAHTFQFRQSDPGSGWAVTAVSGIGSDSDIPAGTEVPLSAPFTTRAAVIRIGAGAVGDTGFLKAVTPADIPADPILADGELTQEQTLAEGSSYFDEWGTGSGLKCKIIVEDPDEWGDSRIQYSVKERGAGYLAKEGTEALIKIVHEELGEMLVTADVNALGWVQQITSCILHKSPWMDKTKPYYWRFNAPAPTFAAFPAAGVYDMAGRQPSAAPVFGITAALRTQTLFADIYNLVFDVRNGGNGFTRSYPTANLQDADADIVFLDLRFQSEIEGVLCDRHLYAVGRLHRDIQYNSQTGQYYTAAITGVLDRIEQVTGWYDDGMALGAGSDPSALFVPNPGISTAFAYTGSWTFFDKRVFSAGSGSSGTAAAAVMVSPAGLWYRKNGRVDGARWSQYYGKEYAWHATRGFDASHKEIRASLFTDAGQPSVAGQNLMAHAVAQYEKPNGWFTAEMRAEFTDSFAGDPLIRNWTPDAEVTDDDEVTVRLDIIDGGEYTPEIAETPTGEGAVLEVESEYNHAMAVPEVTFKIKAAEGGKDYFTRPGVDSIDVNLYYREGTLEYAYALSLPAHAGNNGALVLDGADAQGWVSVTAPAVYFAAPPENESQASLENTDGSQTAKAKITVSKTESGWRAEAVILTDGNGKPKSSGGWRVGDAARYDPGGGYVEGFAAAELVQTKSYTCAMADGGSYTRDIRTLAGSLVISGKTYEVTVTGTSFQSGASVLERDAANPDSQVYQVLTDETAAGVKTYWKYVNGKWTKEAAGGTPGTDDSINRLQYVYNGKLIAFAGWNAPPFWLRFDGEELAKGGFTIKREVDYDLTAPEEFKNLPVNTVLDPAVPARFCDDPADSPSVIYFDNGRWWFAGTPSEPTRIWVSKPVKDAGDTNLDFSTYINFLTVTQELLPFQARNKLNTNRLAAAAEGALGFAREAGENETKGKDITFGIIPPRIIGTPYFKDGAEVTQATDAIILDAASVPQPGEYDVEAMADIQRNAAFYYSLCQLKVTIPGVFCNVTADTDGFEIRVYNHPIDAEFKIGVSFGAGLRLDCDVQLAVPYTAWGSGLASAGIMIGAGVAATLAGASVELAAVPISLAIILPATYFATKAIIKNFYNKIELNLTDGSTADDSGFDSIYDGWNGMQMTKDSLVAKKDYLLSSNKLYEDKQPFVMRRWRVEEEHYSTAGCGFTFVMSSEEKEDINIITNNRSFFISTTSSERIMPATVNGEAQTAQTGSFFGSEKLQPAKAADALYYLQRGGQRIMRAYWQPNVPVPSIGDIQKYNREILRNREVVSMKSSKSLPAQVWCVMKDGGVALATDAAGGGAPAWGRITTGAGRILDTAPLPINGMSVLRTVAIKTEKGVFFCGIPEQQSEPEDIFLDAWQPYLSDVRGTYGAAAVVHDKETNRVYPLASAPPTGPGLYIGYPYMSMFRTLPAPETQALKPVRTARVRMRFMESELPFIKGCPSGAVNKMVSLHKGRYVDGVADIPVPGNVELDAAFEVFTEAPGPLSVLCLLTEDEV
jgi:hypothetical protein